MRAWISGAVWGLITILAAPAAQAHEFIVYFEHGSTEIPPRFRQVIVDSACWGRLPGVEVRVTARADSSGSLAYNQALSERRARALGDALIAEGVDPARVTALGRGETHPSVATGDGVREPLNRNASIALAFGPTPTSVSHTCGPRLEFPGAGR